MHPIIGDGATQASDRGAGDTGTPTVENKSRLDEEALSKLAADPTAEDGTPVNLHPDLSLRWKHWVVKGLPKEQKEELLKKYVRKGEYQFEAPKVNPEVEATMADITTKGTNIFNKRRTYWDLPWLDLVQQFR